MTVENVVDDGLTEQERAALADDDEDTTAAAGDGEGAPNDKEEGQQTPADTVPAATEAAAGADATPAADGGADATAEGSPQPASVLVATVPEGAEARLTEIGTQKDALLEKFDNGDITAREYQKELDTLNKAERQLEYQVNEAKLADKLNQQRLQNDWITTCNAFVESHPIYKDNARLYKALDQEVREIATKPETANWSGQRFLDEAHKNLKAAFGFQDADAPKPKPTPKQREDLPPNLAKVPAADVEDTNGGRFAVLDRMQSTDPLGYEKALTAMSEAERNAYLAA